MKTYRKAKWLGIAAVGIILASFLPAQSMADKFPSKPINLIVPYGPGGGADVTGRKIAAAMEKYLGVPVVCKNVPGAGGIAGFTTLWRSKPDGYTIGIYYAQIASSTSILKKTEYDPFKFEIIGQMCYDYSLLAVPKGYPFRSVRDFKKSEKPVRFCIMSYTSTRTFGGLGIAESLGFPISLVSGYKGGASTVMGIMKGEGDFVILSSTVHRFAKAGDVIPILSVSEKKSPEYPNIETLEEAGLPKYLAKLTDLYYVLWAPPGAPKERLKVIEDAMVKAVHDNEKWFNDNYHYPQPIRGEDFKSTLKETYDFVYKYKDIVKNYREKQKK